MTARRRPAAGRGAPAASALAAALLAASAAAHAAAAERDDPAGCALAATTAAMLACADEAFLAANDRMAQETRQLMERVAPSRRAQLRRMQSAWIAYRTRACRFEASAAAGGSLAPVIQWTCAARMTRERAEALARMARCPEGEVACPDAPARTRGARGAPTAVAAAHAIATDTGLLAGMVEDGVAIHRGIPYAAPPVGARRWREPAPPAPWPGVRNAVDPGPSCPQKRVASLEGGGDPGVLDEDCLTLNVFSPADAAPGARLPVMVWIHGGALALGGGGLAIYDGRALARRGAVVVTINYRLGALGWFAHPSLERARPGGPVNFGLLDQIEALRWVRRNIATFGGDPGNVTIFGQSAGAQSVLALMASPPARGLFHKAIAQSPYGIPSHARSHAVRTGAAIASAVGLPGERASPAALRAVPAERLVALEGRALSLAPSLVVGDVAVPVPLLRAFREGRQARVPLVVGSTSDEASVAGAFGVDPAALVDRLGAARVLVRPLYPDGIDDAALGREVVRDVVFGAFARRIAFLHSARAPTWRYWFDHLPAARRPAPPGVPHGGEVAFVFGTTARCDCLGGPAQPVDAAVEDRVGDRWVAFARAGEPTGPVDWPRDGRARPVVLEIAADDAARPAFLQRRLDAFIGALNLVEPRERTLGPGP